MESHDVFCFAVLHLLALRNSLSPLEFTAKEDKAVNHPLGELTNRNVKTRQQLPKAHTRRLIVTPGRLCLGPHQFVCRCASLLVVDLH